MVPVSGEAVLGVRSNGVKDTLPGVTKYSSLCNAGGVFRSRSRGGSREEVGPSGVGDADSASVTDSKLSDLLVGSAAGVAASKSTIESGGKQERSPQMSKKQKQKKQTQANIPTNLSSPS